MTLIREDFGTGGSGFAPKQGSKRFPSLATTLRDVADDLAALKSATPVVAEPAWVTGAAVANHELEIATRGPVLTVQATAGTSAGPKAVVSTAPAAGQVQVVYTDGVPTLTFNADDAVTEAAYVQLVISAAAQLPTLKTIKG